MSREVRVVLVGIGGYGQVYVNAMLDSADDKNARIVGAVDTRPEGCTRLAELKQTGVPVFESLADFYKTGQAELAVISTSIHSHADLTGMALSHGSNVLCEKPLAATIQEGLAMQTVAHEAGRFVAIGYQWSFSKAIQSLKADVQKGVFGAPRRLKTMVCWPREEGYYARNDWAGHLKSADGRWVLDSPANNATAHYLHNMFYVLGEQRHTSAMPVEATAELYRAKPIENFDTGAVRCRTADGVEILFLTTHSSACSLGPLSHYEFEDADVYYGGLGQCGEFVARRKDGSVKKYGSPNAGEADKLWECVEAVHTGATVACGVSAASAALLCVNAMHESAEIVQVPPDAVGCVGEGSGRVIHIHGLESIYIQCYDQGALPGELGGVGWAKTGKTIDLREYRRFQGSKEFDELSADLREAQ